MHYVTSNGVESRVDLNSNDWILVSGSEPGNTWNTHLFLDDLLWITPTLTTYPWNVPGVDSNTWIRDVSVYDTPLYFRHIMSIDNKCSNGGLCVDGINSYSCDCIFPYLEPYCEKTICEGRDLELCGIYGTCVITNDSYLCVCNDGYELDNNGYCTINTNDCNPNPCLNDGSCIDGINSYECICLEGYKGENCESSTIHSCVESATIQITADNQYFLYVNGQLIGTDNRWEDAEYYNVTLQEGDNLVAVKINEFHSGSPHGLWMYYTTSSGISSRVDINPNDWILVSDTTPDSKWNSDLEFDDSLWITPTPTTYPWNVAGVDSNTWIRDSSVYKTPVYFRHIIKVDTRCYNGGECIDDDNSYSCFCIEGFDGIKCQIDTIDNCDESASIQITADNEYFLYVNGELVGTDNRWEDAESYQVNVHNGDNLIAVKVNEFHLGSPHGLWLHYVTSNGVESRVVLDSNDWSLVSGSEPSNTWNTDLSFDDSLWITPTHTTYPWNVPGVESNTWIRDVTVYDTPLYFRHIMSIDKCFNGSICVDGINSYSCY